MGDLASSKRRFRRLGLVAVLLLVLGGLYILLRPQQDDFRVGQSRKVTPSRSFVLTVGPPLLGAKPPTFDAVQGDMVTMAIRAEVAGEFHLHGYDRSIQLKPGEYANLSLTASQIGQFSIELHESQGRHRQIGKLVVQPE